MTTIVQPFHSIRYDGTNGAYIAGTWCTGVTFVSDTGTVLTYIMYDGIRRMNLGEWAVVSFFTDTELQIFTEAEYATRFYTLPEA